MKGPKCLDNMNHDLHADHTMNAQQHPGDRDRAEAIRQWIGLLGSEHVACDLEACSQAQQATFATSQHIPAILRPGSREEVARCLEIANTFRFPLYPIACGKNWGYGSRVPPQDGCAILSLERLNRIIDVDEKLGCVTIEPGVTFAQLGRYLKSRQSRFIAGCPGSTPLASVVGNALERGVVQGPDADRWQQVAAIEAYLPNGKIIRTGTARFDTRRSGFSQVSVGPSLDGLFFQSNFGVVTEMTIWLPPKPVASSFFSFDVSDADRLPPLVDALQQARMDGLLSSCCTLLNCYRVLACLRQYPYAETGGVTPMSTEALRMLKAEYGLASWMGTGSLLAAGQAELAAKQESLAKRLTSVSSHFAYADPDQPNPYTDDLQETSLAVAYWRSRFGPPKNPDPDRDRCGILWCSQAIPFDGDTFVDCCDVIGRVMGDFGLEPSISLQCISPRAGHLMAAICFDRTTAGQDESAIDCHRQLTRTLAADGILPYRMPPCSYDALPPVGDDSLDVLADIKDVTDHHRILAPGRYEFRRRDQS